MEGERWEEKRQGDRGRQGKGKRVELVVSRSPLCGVWKICFSDNHVVVRTAMLFAQLRVSKL